MKAVVCQNAELTVREIPEQTPAKGQALLKVLRCGICGCDLHMRHHCDDMRSALHQSGYFHFPPSDQPLVFGHEFCGEVLDYGAGSDRKIKVGTRVCAVPLIDHGQGIGMVGLSGRTPGAYAERVLVQESLMLPIPNGLSDDMAALTEPMALALHTVRRSGIGPTDLAVVMGCGAVGLAVVCMLKAMGVQMVVASDFSPQRLQLALRCGADTVVDLNDDAPYANWADHGFAHSLESQLVSAMALHDMPSQQAMPVIFECVGLAGVMQTIVDGAPQSARVVVAGNCRQPDEMEPVMVSHKELDIRLAKGYTPLEFRDALHLIGEGKVACAAMVSGVVGLAGVDAAFQALARSEHISKVLIDPSRSVSPD